MHPKRFLFPAGLVLITIGPLDLLFGSFNDRVVGLLGLAQSSAKEEVSNKITCASIMKH